MAACNPSGIKNSACLACGDDALLIKLGFNSTNMLIKCCILIICIKFYIYFNSTNSLLILYYTSTKWNGRLVNVDKGAGMNGSTGSQVLK